MGSDAGTGRDGAGGEGMLGGWGAKRPAEEAHAGVPPAVRQDRVQKGQGLGPEPDTVTHAGAAADGSAGNGPGHYGGRRKIF